MAAAVFCIVGEQNSSVGQMLLFWFTITCGWNFQIIQNKVPKTGLGQGSRHRSSIFDILSLLCVPSFIFFYRLEWKGDKWYMLELGEDGNRGFLVIHPHSYTDMQTGNCDHLDLLQKKDLQEMSQCGNDCKIPSGFESYQFWAIIKSGIMPPITLEQISLFSVGSILYLAL